MRSLILTGLCLAGSCARPAQTQAPAAKKQAPAAVPKRKSALDKATLESYLRHLNVLDSRFKVEIGNPKPAAIPGLLEVAVHVSFDTYNQDEVFYVSRDGQRILRGTVYDVKDNPFRSDLNKLKTEFQPSMGTPGAPVVLVVFSDFECPFCREEAKMLRQNLLSAYPKQVRLYYKDFPIEQIHPWAKMASIAGRCVFRQNPAAFWDFYDWAFEHQGEINLENLKSKVLEFAQSKSNVIDGLQLARCVDTKATEAEVDKNMADARALQILSIPTIFVNGRRIAGNQGWPALRQVIDYEIEYQKTAKNAGEDSCCELRAPTPLAQ